MSVMNQIDSSYERDELTGLLTMDGIIHYLQAGYSGKCRHGCMVYMSIPMFKMLNVRYGYEHGNRFLQAVAQGVLEMLPCAYAARESSHHFVFMIPGMEPEKVKEGLHGLQNKVNHIPRGDRISLKAGIAECEAPADPFETMDRARQACFYAERHKESFQVFDEQVSKELRFQEYLVSNFEEALDRGDIQPFYQPEIRVLTGECCGYEALARWIDKRYGMISPGIFIPLFEQETLIHKLDLHIIRMVCKDLRYAIDNAWQVVPVSVNLSRVDFQMMDVIREIEKCREEYDIPRRLLHIEITESAVTEGEEYLASIIDKFREMGYQIWMDDFGSGYSSLNNLQMYHFDVLKIDMSFLKQLPENPRTRIIVASVVNMAKRLGMQTLAEGVETKEQYDFLVEIGCEKLQGFLFGRPERLIRSPEGNYFKTDAEGVKILETPARRKYYSRIGKINMLSPTPMEEELLQEKNRLPITVLETTDGGEIHFLYGNEAYLRFLHSVKIDDLESAQKRSNEQYLAENTAFLRLARRAEAAGRMQGELLINGVLFNTDIQFITRQGDKAAFLTIVKELGQRSSEKQIQGIAMAEEYVLSAYFRIDLFDENGTVVNLYLDADQRKLTDLDSDAVRLVRQYAERYICPDESESFCDFYDMKTILERVKKNGGHHVTKFFHSAISGEQGRLQNYTIIPFRVMHRWNYLSLCQYPEIPPRAVLEDLLRKKEQK